jgi:hypothetical protein
MEQPDGGWGAGEAGRPAPEVVAAMVAAVVALERGGRVAAVRWRSVWPDPSPWRLIGRQQSMRGGWPW